MRTRVKTFDVKRQFTLLQHEDTDQIQQSQEETKQVSKDLDSIQKGLPTLKLLTDKEEQFEINLFNQLKLQCQNGSFEPGTCVQICQKIQDYLQPSKLTYGIIIYSGAFGDQFSFNITLKANQRWFQVEHQYTDYYVYQTYPEPVMGNAMNINDEKAIKIAKNYKSFLSFEPKGGYTPKHYAIAINQAFQKKNITPRLIYCKKEPSGDQFWDYYCNSPAKFHSWEFIKDKSIGVAVCL